MSVYKKLHQVQSATRSLSANTEGQTGSARYNYVSGAKLLGVIRPLMDKLGLLLTQEVVEINNQPISYMTRNGEKTEMFTTAHIRFTWVDVEDGSTIVNDFFANGMNAWDKGLGSALTYAERYYLMKTLHIATDEDDIDALVKDEAIRPAQQNISQAKATRTPKAYKPLDEELYWKIIKNYANGVKAKSGQDYLTAWITMTGAGQEQINKFNSDVYNYKVAHEALANQPQPQSQQSDLF